MQILEMKKIKDIKVQEYLLFDYLFDMIQSIFRYRFSEALTIKYSDLKAGKNLMGVIEKVYGPQGHGILFVDGIPDFIEMRKATLPLFSKIADLPQPILKKYTRPQIYHSLGWSHGVEQFHGQYDTAKGSYYVNCCTDQLQEIPKNQRIFYSEEELQKKACNRWIDELPEIEKNVKALSRLMIDVGILLAQQIDSYVGETIPSYEKNQLTRIISSGKSHIGRMLHYFPYDDKGVTEDDWCGWHNDHGSLTALTSAMYVDEEGNQQKVQAKSGGLFAQNRFTEMARIAIPPHMLAFQIGESAQIKTGGYLEATPHCVVRSSEIAGKNISRNTFALFMEPDDLEIMKTPDGVDPDKVYLTKAYKIPQIRERWENNMFFKDFNWKTLQTYS